MTLMDGTSNPRKARPQQHEPSDLILFISAKPTTVDKQAEVEVMAFDPQVTVQRVEDYTEISTPRLLAGRSFYRGLASIRAYIEDEKSQANELRDSA